MLPSQVDRHFDTTSYWQEQCLVQFSFSRVTEKFLSRGKMRFFCQIISWILRNVRLKIVPIYQTRMFPFLTWIETTSSFWNQKFHISPCQNLSLTAKTYYISNSCYISVRMNATLKVFLLRNKKYDTIAEKEMLGFHYRVINFASRIHWPKQSS